MALKIYTAPVTEPISSVEINMHLRIDETIEDALIDNLITTAREVVEAISRRTLITQTWDLVMDSFPASDELVIPNPPLQSVVSVTYIDQNNVSATFAASNYAVDTYSEPGRIKLVSGAAWPGSQLYTLNGVRVRFTAGFGDASAVPNRYKEAIMLLVAHWYANREQGSEKAIQDIPFGVNALLWLDRNLRL